MSTRDLFTFSNRHFRIGVGITVGMLVVTAVAGFIVLPFAQPWVQFANVWDAICSAAGVPQRAAIVTAPEQTKRLSEVVLTSHTLSRPSQEAIGRGATLAQRCAICHGPTGISRADSPNLAGQYAAVIYKELHDFRSGARSNAVMSPFAVNLTDEEIADLSNYYAYLPRLPAYHPNAAIAETQHRHLRRADARHRALRRLPWQPRQQDRQPVAGGTVRSLSEGAASGVCLKRSAQRHQPADAQHRPRHDAAGDRGRRGILRLAATRCREGGGLIVFVIASEAKQSKFLRGDSLDCFVARAPRNDGGESVPYDDASFGRP